MRQMLSVPRPARPARPAPFAYLQYLEWILLAVALLSELLPGPFTGIPTFPWLQVFIVFGFALLGLHLPAGSRLWKVVHIGASFALLVPVLAGAGRSNLVPFLLLLLVLRGCLMFALPGRLVVAALAYVAFLVSLLWRLPNLIMLGALPHGAPPFAQHEHLPPPPLPLQIPLPPRPFGQMPIADDLRGAFVHMVMHSALLFGFALAFVLLLIHAMLAEREGREQLEAANHRLRAFARRIEDQAALEERNRIARDIHDSLGHSLTALNMQMEIALTLLTLAPERAQPYVADAKRLGSSALQAVRASVSALRTQPLSDRSLVEAVEELVRDCAQAADLKIDWTVAVDSALTAEVATTLYRLVQEALTNICRHARATRVRVRVVEVSGAVELCIEDDGKGFDLAANTSGFGLAGMRERAGAVGGAITIESAPGAGCRIRGHFPLVEVPV